MSSSGKFELKYYHSFLFFFEYFCYKNVDGLEVLTWKSAISSGGTLPRFIRPKDCLPFPSAFRERGFLEDLPFDRVNRGVLLELTSQDLLPIYYKIWEILIKEMNNNSRANQCATNSFFNNLN